MGKQPLIDLDAAAARLGTSRRHVRRLSTEDRKIAYVKVGGRVMFDPDDLEVWIDAQKKPALR